MGVCCSEDCCPTASMRSVWPNGVVGPYAAGYIYNDTDPNVPCCKCAFTDDLCASINPDFPHTFGDCGPCGCMPSKVMQHLRTLDECLNETNVIKLQCPHDTPTWVQAKCKCECQVDPNSCDPGFEFYDTVCKCVCPKELIKCEGGNPCPDSNAPNYHPEDCSCKCDLDPANGGAGCGADVSKPDFNPEKCECYCAKDLPTGTTCSGATPYLDASKCECYCPDSVAESCTIEEYFDAATCSCKPCTVPCQGSNQRRKDCECFCAKDLPAGPDCPDSEPYLDTSICECYCPDSIAANCADDETFDVETCACVYDVSSQLSLTFIP